MSDTRKKAYEKLDRFLRNNLSDEDYADYSSSLEGLFDSAFSDSCFKSITEKTLADVKAGIPARDAEIEALRKENAGLREQLEAIVAGWANGSLMPGAVSAEPVQFMLEIRTLGNYGAAYDMPGARRAYTYDHQPGNVKASRIGNAFSQAGVTSSGDTIDRGLGLLKELQSQGFGVFDIEPARKEQA